MQSASPRLDQAVLPIMPETGRRLRDLMDLSSTRNPQLQAVLLCDPGAAIAVFRELNRTRRGAAEQVTDVAHAVSLIGMEAFRRLIQGLPEVTPRDPSALSTASPTFAYSEAAHAACYAGALSAQRTLGRDEEHATAALLQHPAVLALWATEPEAAQRASNAVRQGVAAAVAFGAELREPLADADRRLARDWGLPRLARQVIEGHDDGHARAHLVRLADALAHHTASGWRVEETRTAVEGLAEFLDLDGPAASAWLHRAAVDAARTLFPMCYPLAAFELLSLGDAPDDADEALAQLERRRAARAAAQAPAKPDLSTTMAELMRRIRQEAGAARVVFAMLNRERSHLRTRLALGAAAEDGLRTLDLELAQKNLFTLLMQKPQSLWLNPDNSGRYQGYLPAPLRGALAPDGAYIMSLFVGDRPLGLMYGDGGRLSEDGYRQFRDLCREATAALTGGAGGAGGTGSAGHATA